MSIHRSHTYYAQGPMNQGPYPYPPQYAYRPPDTLLRRPTVGSWLFYFLIYFLANLVFAMGIIWLAVASFSQICSVEKQNFSRVMLVFHLIGYAILIIIFFVGRSQGWLT